MEEIQFNLSHLKNDEEKANALMEWLANRAYAFDKSQYSKICLYLEDTVESCLAIELCLIMNTFAGIQCYVPRKMAKKCRYYAKSAAIKPVSMFKWYRHASALDTMFWDAQSTVDNEIYNGGAPIFAGVSHKTIDFIAKNLYGWLDDRKAYLKKIKLENKAAKKAAKEEQKLIKQFKKELYTGGDYAHTDDQR